MKMFSIVGWSGSGKTLLITRLIEEFKTRGKRVIAVKSTHAGYGLQPEGKDTARFLRAGAREAYLLAGGELLRMTPIDTAGELLAELRQRLEADDIVLLEGLTQPGIPVIEVQDPRPGKELKTRPADLAAVVGATDQTLSRPRFHADDIQGISAFMEAYHER
jgi:molybdopterin-guanine dinucleotide biosynthesis adapter protein